MDWDVGLPQPVLVRATDAGIPWAVLLKLPERRHGQESYTWRRVHQIVGWPWRVDYLWWTDTPIARRYFRLVLETGQKVAVFQDLRSDKWYGQQV